MQKNTAAAKSFSGRRLVEARGTRKREEIAVIVDVTVWTIERWEKGESEPGASQLAAIARFTGHPIDFFFEAA